jgi:hypothetical protein
MFDLQRFALIEMTDLGARLRKLGQGAGSMEEAANRVVRYLYDHLLGETDGQKQCVLVRLFKTHPYGELDEALRKSADEMLGDATASPDMKCLVLVATAGDKPEWNIRTASKGHKAIPLTSEKTLESLPMIAQLVTQLGLSAHDLLRADPALMLEFGHKGFNVFHVPEAQGSPYVPAQTEFVLPCGVQSVLGFGGLLPPADLFAVIMFARVPITRETAELFKTLALSVRLVMIPFVTNVFARATEPLEVADRAGE